MSKNSEYVINHIRKRKLDLIKVLGGECCLCHFNSFPSALEFHHVNPEEKLFGITDSNAVTKALDKQLEELKKCVLLCANCHRGVHAGILSIPDNYKEFYNEEIASSLRKELEQIKTKTIYRCQRCGILISKGATYCPECSQLLSRTVERPNREELKELIRSKPFTQIANIYGVSDNAIRKWCIAENLPYRKKDINQYSDQEWEKI